MPAAIARIGREKRLATLARNLFVIEGPNRAEDLRRAEHALLRENPWLAEAEAFRSGAIVVVPSDLGLATTPRVEQPHADLQGLLQESVHRLQLAESSLRAGFAASAARARESLERLTNPEFLTELQKVARETARTAPEVQRRLEQRLDDQARHEKQIGEAIQAAVSEIERLRKLAPR